MLAMGSTVFFGVCLGQKSRAMLSVLPCSPAALWRVFLFFIFPTSRFLVV